MMLSIGSKKIFEKEDIGSINDISIGLSLLGFLVENNEDWKGESMSWAADTIRQIGSQLAKNGYVVLYNSDADILQFFGNQTELMVTAKNSNEIVFSSSEFRKIFDGRWEVFKV